MIDYFESLDCPIEHLTLDLYTINLEHPTRDAWMRALVNEWDVGQLRPIVINEHFEVIDGNKLVRCAIENGKDWVACAQAFFDCYEELVPIYSFAASIVLNRYNNQVDLAGFAKKLQKLSESDLYLLCELTGLSIKRFMDIKDLVDSPWTIRIERKYQGVGTLFTAEEMGVEQLHTMEFPARTEVSDIEKLITGALDYRKNKTRRKRKKAKEIVDATTVMDLEAFVDDTPHKSFETAKQQPKSLFAMNEMVDLKDVEKPKGRKPLNIALEIDMPPNSSMILTTQDVERMVRLTLCANVIAIDTETTGLNWTNKDVFLVTLSASVNIELTDLEDDVETLDVMPYVNKHTVYSWACDMREPIAEEFLAALRTICEDDTIIKCFWNYKFDAKMLAKLGVEIQHPIHDVQLMCAFSDTRYFPFKLKGVSDKVLPKINPELYDKPSKFQEMLDEYIPTRNDISEPNNKGKRYDEAPIKLMTVYALYDTIYTLELFFYFQKMLLQEKTWKPYDEQRWLLDALLRSEIWGAPFDFNHIIKLENEFEREKLSLRDGIFDASGGAFDLDSADDLAAVLADKHRVFLTKRTKTGKISTSKYELEKFDKVPVIKDIITYNELKTMLSNFLPNLQRKCVDMVLDGMLIGPGERVHSDFFPVARTGRISSTFPNLHNIPRDDVRIKSGFVCYPGTCLMDFDYSQIELRVLAYYSRDSRMVEAFERGEDIHAWTAALMFEVSLEETYTKEFHGVKLRQVGKTINFMLAFGGGYKSLAAKLGIELSQAKAAVAKHKRQFHEVEKYRNFVFETVKRNKYIKIMGGAIRKFTDQDNLYTQGINTLIQGSAGYIFKKAYVDLDRYLLQKGLKSQVILNIHDDFRMEIPFDEIMHVPMFKHIMETSVSLKREEFNIPLKVDIKWTKTHCGEMEKIPDVKKFLEEFKDVA